MSELVDRRVRGLRSVRVRNAYEQNGAVYRAVLAVAGALAEAPLEPWIGGDRKTGKLVDTGQLPLLLKKPNRLMGQRDFKFAVAAQAMLFRHSDVMVKEGRLTGQVAELIPLPPGSIKPIRPRSDPLELIGWRFSYFGHYDTLGPHEIIRFRYALDPLDPGLGGVNPFLPVENVIDTDHAATLYNKSALENGGSFGGIVQIEPPPGEDIEEIDDDVANEIRRRLDERLHGGPEAAERIAVISHRMKWIPTGRAAKDLQYIQGKALNVKEIARAPGIPPLFMNEFEGIGLGIDGLATQHLMLYHNAVMPFATGMAEQLTEKVAHRFDERITIIYNFDNVAALKEDARARLERAKLLKDLEYSQNDINDALDLGMPKTKDGDVVLVQAGLIPKTMAITGEALGFGMPESEPPAKDEPPSAPAAPESMPATSVADERASAIIEIVKDVAAEELPRDSAIAALKLLYGLTQEQAEEILGSAGEKSPPSSSPPTLPPPSAPIEAAGASALKARLHRDAVERRRSRMWRKYVNQVKPYERRVLKLIRDNLKAQLPNIEGALESRGTSAALTRDAKDDAAAAANAFDPEALADAVRTELLRTFAAGAKSAGKQLVDLGIISDAVLEAESDRLPELSEQYFAVRKGRIVGSGETIQERLRSSLLEGYSQGEALSDLVSRVRDVIEDASLKQARTIARTEAHTAANNGRFTLMKRQKVEKHEWLSARDGNERPSHSVAGGVDGERRRVGEPFSNGAVFPGEGDDPAEVINCRCTTVPVSEEFEAFEEETTEAAALDADDLWSRNLARRAVQLRVEAPCDAITRRIPAIAAEIERSRATAAGGFAALRSRMPELVENPAVAGAVRTLGGTLFASLWLEAWREAA